MGKSIRSKRMRKNKAIRAEKWQSLHDERLMSVVANLQKKIDTSMDDAGPAAPAEGTDIKMDGSGEVIPANNALGKRKKQLRRKAERVRSKRLRSKSRKRTTSTVVKKGGKTRFKL